MSVANPIIDFIDGDARIIHLLPGVTTWHPVDDIYFEVRRLRSTTPSVRPFFPFVEALEIIDKGGGNFTSRAARLLGGTRIRPFNEDIKQTIIGELLSDEGLSGLSLIDLSQITEPFKIEYVPPPTAELRQINTGSGLTAEQDAALKLVKSAVAGPSNRSDGPDSKNDVTFLDDDGVTPLRTVRFDGDSREVL